MGFWLFYLIMVLMMLCSPKYSSLTCSPEWVPQDFFFIRIVANLVGKKYTITGVENTFARRHPTTWNVLASALASNLTQPRVVCWLYLAVTVMIMFGQWTVPMQVYVATNIYNPCHFNLKHMNFDWVNVTLQSLCRAGKFFQYSSVCLFGLVSWFMLSLIARGGFQYFRTFTDDLSRYGCLLDEA